MAQRETKFARTKLSGIRADGTFSGYASLFGKPDLGNDIVMAGAFAASLSRRGAAGVRMLFQHDPNQPIGVWTRIAEDRLGLRVTGRLTTSVSKAREVKDLLLAGAVDGLSIGYRTVRSRLDRKSGPRRILEADLWEISIVTFPMQPGARIEAFPTGVAAGEMASGHALIASRMRRAARSITRSY